jgi:23S rRNA pseudouridine1911/1915/1917 synthase
MVAEHESRGFEYGVIHWRSMEPGILKTQIAQSLNLPEDQLLELLKLGAVYSESGRMKNWEDLEKNSPASTYIRLHTRPRRFEAPRDLQSKVIFSHPDFLLVNKPVNLPCHATVDNQVENLLSCLSTELAIPLYITHRLDVGTEGLLTLAKTKKFQSYFNRELHMGRVKKTYQAKVQGHAPWLPGELLTHWMKPSPRAPKELSPSPEEGWARCELRIISCEFDASASDRPTSSVDLELLTGRTHQIRAQLSHQGYPLTGDILYGAMPSVDGTGFRLRSQSIGFDFENKSWLFQL